MSFFALLPLEETNFEDFIDWFGKSHEDNNRLEFTNAINILDSKGLITRKGHQISMHKMLRESVLYQERKGMNCFISQIFNVVFLTSRIKEGADHNLFQALRFLKFGESILSNIKEPYRKSIYQPLLQLENEVLNIYNWLKNKGNLTQRWKDLSIRAENNLSQNDHLFGIILNNYGLALANEGLWKEAAVEFEKSIEILESSDKKVLPQLLISLCNLCQLFIKQKKMIRFSECFQTIQDLREKHNIWNDISMPVQSLTLGLANLENHNYPKAVEFFKLAIKLYHDLPDENKNSVNLLYYYIKLAEAFFLNKELENSEKAILIAHRLLTELKSEGLVHRGAIINLMINIAEEKGEHEIAKKLKDILSKE